MNCLESQAERFALSLKVLPLRKQSRASSLRFAQWRPAQAQPTRPAVFLAKDSGPMSEPLEWAVRAHGMPRPVQDVVKGVWGWRWVAVVIEEGEWKEKKKGRREERGRRREDKVPVFEKPVLLEKPENLMTTEPSPKFRSGDKRCVVQQAGGGRGWLEHGWRKQEGKLPGGEETSGGFGDTEGTVGTH